MFKKILVRGIEVCHVVKEQESLPGRRDGMGKSNEWEGEENGCVWLEHISAGEEARKR